MTGDADTPPVLADAQLLRQVVVNLVSNAIKYTPDGRDHRRSPRAGRAGTIRWSVRDSGIGIPAASQSKLFEKFYRAENVLALETEGTGLGLYLVRLIMEQLEGRVWCTSEEGAGSTFVFTLPPAERAVTAARRILLVEDDRLLRRACEASLRQRGFTVATAGDGEEALRQVRAERPDLILLDLLMPRMTGIEVLRTLRAEAATREIPVLILSNSSREQDARRSGPLVWRAISSRPTCRCRSWASR